MSPLLLRPHGREAQGQPRRRALPVWVAANPRHLQADGAAVEVLRTMPRRAQRSGSRLARERPRPRDRGVRTERRVEPRLHVGPQPRPGRGGIGFLQRGGDAPQPPTSGLRPANPSPDSPSTDSRATPRALMRARPGEAEGTRCGSSRTWGFARTRVARAMASASIHAGGGSNPPSPKPPIRFAGGGSIPGSGMVNRLRKCVDGGRKPPGFIGRISTPAARDSHTGQPNKPEVERRPGIRRPRGSSSSVSAGRRRRRRGPRRVTRPGGPAGGGPISTGASSRAPAHLASVAGVGQGARAASRGASRRRRRRAAPHRAGRARSNGAAASSGGGVEGVERPTEGVETVGEGIEGRRGRVKRVDGHLDGVFSAPRAPGWGFGGLNEGATRSGGGVEGGSSGRSRRPVAAPGTRRGPGTDRKLAALTGSMTAGARALSRTQCVTACTPRQNFLKFSAGEKPIEPPGRAENRR